MYIMLCTEEYNDKIILAIIIMVTILTSNLQTSKEENTKIVRKREGKERGFVVFIELFTERDRERERNYQSHAWSHNAEITQ